MLQKVASRVSSKSVRGISSVASVKIVPSCSDSLWRVNNNNNIKKNTLGMINNQERNFSTFNMWRSQQQQESSEPNIVEIETQYAKDIADNNDFFVNFAIVAAKFETGKPAVFIDFLGELIQKKDVEGLKAVYYLCTKEKLLEKGFKWLLSDEVLLAAIYDIRSNLKLEEIKQIYSDTSNNILETCNTLLRPVLTKQIQHITINGLERKFITTAEVFEYLKKIATVSKQEKDSLAKQKIQILLQLFSTLKSSHEMRLLVKIISSSCSSSLSGVKKNTFLRYLAEALEKSKLNNSSKLSTSQINESLSNFSKTKDMDLLFEELFTKNSLANLSNDTSPQFQPGTIIPPMLAKPLKEIKDTFLQNLKKSDETQLLCEYKYDGERLLLHYNAATKQIMTFSRNGKPSTLLEDFPEEREVLTNSILQGDKSFIIDCEYIILGKKTGKSLSFHEFQNRSTLSSISTPSICVFDIIYFENESLINSPLFERRLNLDSLVTSINNPTLSVSKAKLFNIANENACISDIYNFMKESLHDSCEGLMIKPVSSKYEFGKRGWFKLKKEYMADGLYDTLDLIPIGGFKGVGKRIGLFGSYLMGVRNPIDGKIYSVCSVGTGLNNEMLETLTEETLKQYIPGPIATDPSVLEEKYGIVISKSIFKQIDCWFQPNLVWEIAGSDILSSSASTSGYSVRFPRFIRKRDDKSVPDSTSLEQLKDMFTAQNSKNE